MSPIDVPVTWEYKMIFDNIDEFEKISLQFEPYTRNEILELFIETLFLTVESIEEDSRIKEKGMSVVFSILSLFDGGQLKLNGFELQVLDNGQNYGDIGWPLHEYLYMNDLETICQKDGEVGQFRLVFIKKLREIANAYDKNELPNLKTLHDLAIELLDLIDCGFDNMTFRLESLGEDEEEILEFITDPENNFFDIFSNYTGRYKGLHIYRDQENRIFNLGGFKYLPILGENIAGNLVNSYKAYLSMQKKKYK